MSRIEKNLPYSPLLEEARALGDRERLNKRSNYLDEYWMIGLLKICDLDLEHDSGQEIRDWGIDKAQQEQNALKIRFGDAGYGTEKRKKAVRQILERIETRPADASSEKTIKWMTCSKSAAGSRTVEAPQLLEAILDDPTAIIRWCLPEFFGRNEDPQFQLDEKSPAEKRTELADHAAILYEIEDALMNRIMGQEEAIDTFIRGLSSLFLFPSQEEKKKGPAAVFLLAGPPGVGKTLLATTAAELLHYELLVLDMSGYSNKEGAIEHLTGFDSTYKASHEGELTGFVDQNPRSLVVFDEIEKASSVVILELLPMLDRGTLMDRFFHREISFSQTICIFTTNAGRSLYDGDRAKAGEISREVILEALQTEVDSETRQPFFPPEICSRLATGTLMMFRHLSASDLTDIGGMAFRQCSESFQKTHAIEVEIDSQIPGILLLRDGGESDARKFRAESEQFFQNEIYKLTSYIEPRNMSDRIGRVRKISFLVDEDPLPVYEAKGSEGIREKSRILVFVPPFLDDRENPDESEDSGNANIVKFVNAVITLQSLYQIDFVHSYAETANRVGKKSDYLFALSLAPVRARTAEEMGDDPAFHPDKPPIGAKRLQTFLREFLQLLNDECPDLPVYIFYTTGGSRAFETELGFLKAGATKVIPVYREEGTSLYDFDTALRSFDRKEEEIRIEREALRFARQRKALRFETKPKMKGKELQVHLCAFQEIRSVSGSDRDMILIDERIPEVSFSNVIGAEDAKAELKNFVNYLKDPERYCDRGLIPPKGVLLYGPPGTGKTFLAEALAHESGAAFFQTNGGDLANRGTYFVESLFVHARRYAPSVIFIDEIDAIGKERTGFSAVEGALNKLLSEMDGFDADQKKPVFVMAATNIQVEREQRGQVILDQALTRRFDRKIEVGLPDTEERRMYLARQLGEFHTDISPEDLDNLAKRSFGCNFAQLKNIVQHAARGAMQKASVPDEYWIDADCLGDALEDEQYGSPQKRTDEGLRRTACHEAGHACLHFILGETPSFATIVGRGHYGGYVMDDPDRHSGSLTRQELLNHIAVCLAGRAAEQIYYGLEGGISTGASSDLQEATKTASELILVYGMGEEEGMGCFPDQSLSEHTQKCVNRILEEQLTRARKLLTDAKPKLDRMTEALLEKNRLNSKEMTEIMNS